MAVDGELYLPPAFGDILARTRTPATQKKIAQGFDTLLLVPFGLSLHRLIDAWCAGLLRTRGRVPELSSLHGRAPVWVSEQYQRETLVYGPTSFGTDHGGRTKADLLRQEGRGWEVLLVEGMTELPREGAVKTVGGRRQLECGRMPAECLRELRGDEIGWTPEAYIVRSLDALARSGNVLDLRTFTYLTGAYLPSSHFVPNAYWNPIDGQASLNARWPGGIRHGDGGVRAAVRVR